MAGIILGKFIQIFASRTSSPFTSSSKTSETQRPDESLYRPMIMTSQKTINISKVGVAPAAPSVVTDTKILTKKLAGLEKQLPIAQDFKRDEKTINYPSLSVDVYTHSEALPLFRETIGKQSGKFFEHMVDGQPVVLDGKTFKHNTVIPVTQDNYKQLLGKDADALELVRQNAVALYLTLLPDAKEFLNTKKPNAIIAEETQKGLDILLQHTQETQKDSDIVLTSKKELSQQEKADFGLMRFLIARGALTVNKEKCFVVKSETAKSALAELVEEMQRIKSTGHGAACKNWIEMYARLY